jgi:antibiotic biosynthesis monooxygenase (ABM) superfamily enzyme
MAKPGAGEQAASLVVEHTVPTGEGLAFRWWHAKLVRKAKRFKGHIRTDLCAPVKGLQPGQPMKWYSIVHFESPQLLNQWMKSRDREALIKAGSKTFASYQFISFATGLEGWFSGQTGTEQSGLAPPAWRQNAAVILALYPTVILQSALFSALGLMQGWPLPSSMIVNNIITSSLLTWLLMPLVTRWLGFWLQPMPRPLALKTELLGAGIIGAALGLMVIVFNVLMV